MAGEAGRGRTHTFGVRGAGAKLKTRAVYQRSDIVLSQGKPIPSDRSKPLTQPSPAAGSFSSQAMLPGRAKPVGSQKNPAA